ncbi:hypothetical protein EG68_03880 [Paragonimus skrjabini miyazakii]|uniref:Msx2-interacting protein n=1 Tax=Paragonimus skrjabini miyazakii TaxID=59628 RepID=A0A8S9YU99_9TREM|nr:hypothetical protein EG68_03880 [Paragonimus skrjabini miyazakii]
MRATRYLWISNLPARTTEQDIRDVLLSHGKIQSVRIHSDGLTYSAVVAFVDTQSATRAIQSTIRINKVNLSLQYCESSGIPGVANQDMLGNSVDSMKTNSSGFSQHGEVQPSRENRSASAFSEFSNSSHDSEGKRKATSWYIPVLECSLFSFSSSHRSDNRLMTSDMESNSSAVSGRFANEQRGLLIRHLPLRSSDTNLREGLFHEYKKHGKITSVVVRGQAEERYCLITFKRSEDAARALELSRGKLFFGIAISVSLHNGIESEDPDLCPPEHALDEYHPKATKTLFVGNLCSNTITQEELRKIFRPYGEIIELDIKVQANQPGTSYAFVQYTDIRSVVRALSNQDAIRVGDKPVKLGFGKSQPTNVVWLDNLPTVTEAFLTRQFGRYGHLTHVVLDRKSSRALLYFDTVEMAQRALNETRNRAFLGRKVQLDYAGYECQVAFMRRLSKNDSFGQAYDDYRERLQKILALFPTYGLSLFGRQKSFGEAPKDNHSTQDDEFDTSPYDRRSSSKHLSSTDRTVEPTTARSKSGLLESSRGKTHSSRIATTSGSTSTSSRHRTLDRDFGLHVSFSSATASRSGSNLPRKRHGHLSSFRPSDSDSRVIGDTARCEVSSRKCLLPGKMSPFLETKRHQNRFKDNKSTPVHSTHRVSSTRGANRSSSHYLGETDDVSSGSLSPVVDALESLPELSSLKREFQPIQNLQRFGVVSKSLVGDGNLTPSRQSTSTSNRQQHYNSVTRENSIPDSYKYHDSVSPRVTHSRVRRRYHNSSEDSSPFHTGFLDTDKNNRHGDREQSEYVCRSRFQPHRQNFSVRNVDSCRSSDNERPSDFVNFSTSNLSFHSVDHVGALMNHSPTAKPEDRKPKLLSGEIRCQQAPSSLGFSQLSDTSGESNDTLTKLELERAKLLRELSLLNNEVVGTKCKSSLNITRKRGSHDTSVDDVRLSKSRRASYSKSIELGDSGGSVLSSESKLPPLPSDPSATDCHVSNGTTESHSSDTCKPLLTSNNVPVLSRQFNGCYSSSSEPGELFSPVTTEHISPGIPACLAFQTTDTCPSSCTKLSTSPKVLTLGASDAFSCRSTLVHSSPQILMPPEPTSPLTRLSSPDSPISTDKLSAEQDVALPRLPRPQPSQSDTYGKDSTMPTASACSVSTNRDPRLMAHLNQISIDIPPPPPPPENLKLPLWVDTSVRSEFPSSKPLSTIKIQSSVVNPPDQRRPSVNDSELEASYHEASSSSLDERIRLLDAQLMKSEKARPAVDYSKFRIRRKIEPSCIVPTVDSLIATSVSSVASTSTITEPCFSPATGLASCGRYRNERGSLSDVMSCSLPCLSSVASSTSPNSSATTSPLSLMRPADTSEFVKSMLSSSRPSPSAPIVDLAVSTAVESVVCSRSLYLRAIPTISSSPSNRTVADTGEKYMSTLSTTQTVMSNNSIRSFGTINCHYLLPTCVVSHSSLNGTQPIGVATRLPSVSHTTDSSLCSDDSTAHLESVGSDQPVKSILKRDMLSPDQFGHAEPDNVMTSDVHLKKSVTGSFQPYINKKLLSQTQGAKLEKFVQPSIKTSISQPSKVSAEIIAACPRSSQHKCAYSRSGSPVEAASKAKPVPPKKVNVLSQRCDIPRPTLDDSIFKTTFSGVLTKEDGKSKRSRIVSSNLSKKKKKILPTSTSETALRSNDGPKIEGNTEGEATGAGGFVQSFERSVSEIRKKEFDKHEDTIFQESKPQVVKGELLSSSDICKQSVSALSSVSKVKVKKKCREIRRRIMNSDSSDAEISERAHRKHCGVSETTPMETGYESMYDKIKRRASKSTGTLSSLAEKTHISQQKAQQKSMQKRSASTKNSRCSQSSVGDSDTDECLSDLSESCENVDATRYQSRRTSLGEKSEQLSRKKQKSSDRRLKANSAMRSKKRLPSHEPADILQSRSIKKGRKTSAPNHLEMNNMERHSTSTKSNGTNISVSNRAKRRAKGTVNRKQDADTSETLIKQKRRRQLLSGPPNDTDCTLFKKTLVSPKTSAAVLSAEQRRILVRRVFASTDSDTPSSLSSSDPETECIENSTDLLSVGGSGSHPDKNGRRRAFTSSSTSRSPSPLASRSCSPDDLGADAAERHTFGAFSLPSGVVDLKDKVSLSPKSISLSDKSSFTKSSTDLHANTSKLTPPTIPMIDSSSSTDQFYSNAGKLRGRDSGDWNIFTSLTKQSTPKQDLSDANCSSKLASDFLTDNSRNKEVISKSQCDFDDELPSLEKHDDEYSNKVNSGSELLLNESTGVTQRGEHRSLNDDDLPPPVVSALEDFCPTDFGDQYDAAAVAHNCVSQQSDVIEEVVYDSLELHLPCNEQAQTASKSPPSLTVKLDCLEGEPPESTDASAITDNKLEPDSRTLLNQSAKCSSADICGSGARLAVITVSPTSSGTSASTSTMSSLTLQSPLFAPLTMLTTTSQSGDLTAVGQPVLVTVPRSAAGVSFTPSSLTFVPASIQPPSAIQNSNAANQRHVALLLPTSSMPLNTPVLSLQNPPVTTVYTTSAVVYNNIATSSNNPSPVCLVSTSNTMTGLCLRRGDSDLVQTTDGICTSSSRKLPISTTPISSTPATSNSFSDSHVGVNPSPVNHNTCFNRSDFTSYVQRVIERVKQEKDEEVMHQREKVRRPKKTSATIVQVPSPSTVCLPSGIESTITSSVLPNTTTSVTLLPAIAPMPSLATLNAYSKQCASASSLDSSLVSNSRLAPDSKFSVKPDPTDVPLTNKTEQKSQIVSDKPVDNAICGPSVPDSQDTEVSMNSKEHALDSKIAESIYPLNTVDEVIDAVVSGQFDESDYLHKLTKGTFAQNPFPCGSINLSPSHPAFEFGTSNTIPVPEQSKTTFPEWDAQRLSATSPNQCSDKAKSSSARNLQLSENCVSSPRIITPMHVLTFVATGTSSSTAQPTSTSTAVSPSLICSASDSSLSLPLSALTGQSSTTSHCSGSSAEVSGAKFFQNFKSIDSTAVPTSNSQLGNIAAQLANDTLTNYFYSLLRQHQLKTSSSPTTSSVESGGNQTTENAQSIRSPATFQTVFKGSSVSTNPAANDTADLLAAFATMAAMASPQRVGSHESTPLLCPVNNNVAHDLPANCETFSSQPCSTASFDLQTYPVAWQGLLSLKNEEVYVQMHFLSGNRDLLKDCMNVIAEQNVTGADPETSLSQPLKIVQRMRLEPSQLDGVQRKLRQVTDFCMCLTLATASPRTAEVSVLNEKVRMNHVLCDGFIKYLVEKCAAGIINVCHPCTQQNLYVIHIFPPCEFARSQLEGTAPTLLRQLSQCSTPYLLVVVTTV